MSDDSRYSASINAAAGAPNIHHATVNDIKIHTPEKLNHLQRGGIRSGPGRTEAQAQQMLDKIPASQRAGVNGESAALKAKKYLEGKDASHIKPHGQGGSSNPDNLKWEAKSINRSRGNQPMTRQEQTQLSVKAGLDNLKGALQSGLQAMPKGAAIGAMTAAPFSILRNTLRVMRGEVSAEEALLEVTKDTGIGSGVGAGAAFSVTAIVSFFPPVAAFLTTISPVLLVAGPGVMVYEFFKILDDHKKEVRAYYQSLTEAELKYLEHLESELAYEHEKNLKFLDETREFNHEISNRPVFPGIEASLKRYQESMAIAESLNIRIDDQKYLEAKNVFLQN